MTHRISIAESIEARSFLNSCFSRPMLPATTANPSPSRPFPMNAPVICALTTSGWPARRMKIARINSGALPNVTLSRPPIALPVQCEISSVPSRM